MSNLLNHVLGIVTKKSIERFHSSLIAAEATANQPYHMVEISKSLIAIVLAKVTLLDDARDIEHSRTQTESVGSWEIRRSEYRVFVN